MTFFYSLRNYSYALYPFHANPNLLVRHRTITVHFKGYPLII